MTELQRLERIRDGIEALQEAERSKANNDELDAFTRATAQAKADAYDQALRLVDAEIIKAGREGRR
jgi:hypothetical protein